MASIAVEAWTRFRRKFDDTGAVTHIVDRQRTLCGVSVVAGPWWEPETDQDVPVNCRRCLSAFRSRRQHGGSREGVDG